MDALDADAFVWRRRIEAGASAHRRISTTLGAGWSEKQDQQHIPARRRCDVSGLGMADFPRKTFYAPRWRNRMLRPNHTVRRIHWTSPDVFCSA
jgi:hypothetical protein